MTTTRDTFEAWSTTNFGCGLLGRLAGGGYVWPDTSLAWSAWQGATAAERERCALVCDDIASGLGGVAAGPFVTDFGKHTHQSMAAGAQNCAAAIRQPLPTGTEQDK